MFFLDSCNPNPCQNGGECIRVVGGMECACINGYYGTTCTLRKDLYLSSRNHTEREGGGGGYGKITILQFCRQVM